MSNPKLERAVMTAAAELAFIVSACVPVHAAAPLPGVHVRGTISDVTPSALTVATSRGPLTLALGPKTTIVEAFPASRSDIKPNSLIGVPNIPGPSNAQAEGVLLLPDAFRNAPANAGWDWPASGGSSMANGTVAPVSHMANGTVSAASSSGPLTVTLNYTSQSGSEFVTIPANTPIVRLAVSNRSALKSGSHLFVFASNNNGQLGAAIIIVGAPGVTPPM